MNRNLLLVGSCIALVGCSSSNFSLGSSSEGDSGLTIDDAVPDEVGSVGAEIDAEQDAEQDDGVVTADGGAVAEGGADDSAVPVEVPADAAMDTWVDPGTPCGTLASDASTLYVNATSTREAVGTATCPFRTIKDALNAITGPVAGLRSVVVAGGAGSVTYLESGALVLKKTRLIGAGVGKVRIQGGGACGAAQCVIVLDGDSSVEGVTIDAGGRIGLMIAPNGSPSAPYAKNVVVRGATSEGGAATVVNGTGQVDLGPGFQAIYNAGIGVHVQAAGSVRVLAGANAFNDNKIGLLVGAGVLQFESGEVMRNKSSGLFLGSLSGTHLVRSATCKDNLGHGLVIEANVAVKVRSSSFVGNQIGVNVRNVLSAATTAIDFGTTADPGKNVFGTKLAKNSRASLCFPNSAKAKIPAYGNVWPACSLGEDFVGGLTCETLTRYADVFYTATAPESGLPLDLGGSCTDTL